ANIIHSAEYPETLEAIEAALEKLHQYPYLSADIEGFSLQFNETGIASIGFAWDQHNGVSFLVDYLPKEKAKGMFDLLQVDEEIPEHIHGVRINNVTVKKALLKFLMTYKGRIRWHNASFDIRSIIAELWMKDLKDIEGTLEGLECLTKNFDDTKIIAYL